ncbi:hypothetical protein [Bradyrhizobium algeriense]|uniref:hypothetical protein n=1 Tax=Bradyrhizobium algeriense TaxID=634784 RepID=UPI000D36B7BC|nr:hypothetical protein [Bradyrhizobium algeriense]
MAGYRHRNGRGASEAFGTIFVVTNLENGKKIRCPVQDRGPFARGRVLDFHARRGAPDRL